MTRPAIVPGTPYHRLARTDRYRWWKPLLELVLFGVFWIVASLMVFPFVGDWLDAEGIVGLTVLTVTIAVFIPSSQLAAAIMRPIGSLASVLGRMRWAWLLEGLALVLAIKSIAVVAGGLFDDQPLHWSGLAKVTPMLLAILVLLPIQSAAEEYAFRGTLLQVLGAWIPVSWIPIVITSVVFALVHFPESWPLGIALGLSGLFMAILTIRTGGLEAAIALHAGNNVTAFWYEAAAGRSETWLGKLNIDISLTNILVSITFDVIAFAGLLFLAGERRVARSA